MYINPFFYGVFVTLFVEMAVTNLVMIARYVAHKNRKTIKPRATSFSSEYRLHYYYHGD